MTDLEKLLSIKALFVDEYKEFILTSGDKILINSLAIGGHAMIDDSRKGRIELERGIYNLMGNIQVTIGPKGRIVSMMVDSNKIPSIKRSDRIEAFLTTVKAGRFDKR